MSGASGLVPQDKFDVKSAEAAVAAGYPAVAPVLKDLVGWLRDCNWPVASVLAPFLAGIGEPLGPVLREVFESHDAVWKYWVLTVLINESVVLRRLMHDDIVAISLAEPGDEDEEELQRAARDILDRGAKGAG